MNLRTETFNRKDRQLIKRRLIANTQEDPSTGCLIWTGTPRKNYGAFPFRGRQDYAHAVAWRIRNRWKPIPPGKHVLHDCQNTLCVRHTRLGTNGRNRVDALELGSFRRCLTHREIEKLGKLYETGGYTQAELAAQFGVSESTVSRICQGNFNLLYRLPAPLKKPA